MSFQASETLERDLRRLGLWSFLEDPEITNIMVGGSTVLVERYSTGVAVVDDLHLQAADLSSLIATIAGTADLLASADRPLLEANLPFRSERIQAILPPVAETPQLIIRKPPARRFSLEDLVQNETLTRWEATYLLEALRHRKTLLIAGGVNSGKTTFLNALLREILDREPLHRLILCEEGARELHAPGPNVVRLLTNDERTITMTRLIRTALRSNPDRIIVGEARGPEAYDFLKASNTGHPGGLLTLHSNDATSAISRLDAMVMEAGVPSQRLQIAEAIDAVLFMAKTPNGRRLVDLLEVLRLGPDGQVITADPRSS